MGQFFYKAVNQTGRHITGHIEAVDRRMAVASLAEKGEFVLELQPKSETVKTEEKEGVSSFSFSTKFFTAGRIHSRDILQFTHQLSTALRAGLPLLNTIEIICQQHHKSAFRYVLNDIADSVRSGQSLSEAMSRHQKVFSQLYISMIRVGETGGILEQTTAQLTSLLERDEKIKTSMKNASAYPLFVLTLGLVSVIVVVTWILPNILQILGGEIAVLPWPTQFLLATSKFFRGLFTTIQGWFFMLLVVGGSVYLAKWLKTKGRAQWDGFKLKIPVLGMVLQTIAVGRFARTLGALTKGGVSILESLSVVRGTLGNEVLGREIDKIGEKVKAGAALAEPLGESGLFPPLLVQITSVGEQTGQLDNLLLNAADTFDEQADSAVTRFMAIFPALLILLLAVVIGFIIVATLLPVIMMSLGTGTL